MLHITKHIKGLPYQRINKVIPLRLEYDTVHLSEKAAQHMRERHPRDYPICIASMEAVIVAPDCVGQSPLHPENFVLIKETDELQLLIALSAIPDEYGEYPVQSSYILNKGALQRRLRKGYLRHL